MHKVLIADDHHEIRRLWAINLSVRGYQVVEAADGQECLTMIEEEKPDLILLDLAMPVLSGWAVLEALEHKSPNKRTPVILVTGWTDDEIQDGARKLGVIGTLTKPFGVDELLINVERALRGAGH